MVPVLCMRVILRRYVEGQAIMIQKRTSIFSRLFFSFSTLCEIKDGKDALTQKRQKMEKTPS